MASWRIHLSEEYLGVFYDRLHEKLYDFHVIQADETPVLVKQHGRDAGAKSSAIIYSIAETSKANLLKPYDHLEYLLTENTKHMPEQNRLFIKNMLS